MEIILLSIYIASWILINGIIYKSGMYEMNPPVAPAIGAIVAVGPNGARHFPPAPPVAGMRELILANFYLILFETITFFAFLLLVFLGPHIQGLNDAEEKTRKQFEKLSDEIFKKPWLDAISERNRYYIMCFLVIVFTPFFYMFFLFRLSPGPPFGADGITAIAVHDQLQVFDVFLLQLTAGFNGFISLIHNIFSKKSWYFYIVPLIHAFAFYKGERSNTASITKNYVVSFVLLLWMFFYLSKSSIVWSFPFIILILLLFMT